MADVLRATARVPRAFAARSHPSGRDQPRAARAQASGLPGLPVHWHDELGGCRRPAVVPRRQRVPRRAAGPPVGPSSGRWYERLVAVDATASSGSPCAARDPFPRPSAGAAETARGHARSSSRPPARLLAEGIAANGSSAARWDGAADRLRRDRRGLTGDTLQAVRAPCRVDPLAAPGEADLSAQVDFRALAEARPAAAPRSSGRCRRARSSDRLGHRGCGCGNCSSARARSSAGSCERGCSRLADPGAMGELFKVLALPRPGGRCRPAFAADLSRAMSCGACSSTRCPGVRHGFFTRAGRGQRGAVGVAQLRPASAATSRTGRSQPGARRGQARRRRRSRLVTARQVHGADGRWRYARPGTTGRRPRRMRWSPIARACCSACSRADCAPGAAGRPRGRRDRRRPRRLEGRAGGRHRGHGGRPWRNWAHRPAGSRPRSGPASASRPTRSGRNSSRASPARSRTARRFFAAGRRDRRCSTSRATSDCACAGREWAGRELCQHDTCAEEGRFFSYRRAAMRGEERFGLQLSAIALDG